MRPEPFHSDDPAAPAPGKILRSAVTREMVEQRARELAIIAGRTPDQVTDTDRAAARGELVGPVHGHPAADDEPPARGGIWESPPTSTGHAAPKHLPDDDHIPQELVEEGVDEAEHDQMLRASRLPDDSEE